MFQMLDRTSLDKLHSAVQLAAFHYIVCLKAEPNNEDNSLKIGNRQFIFQNIKETEERLLHVDFQRWATASVLRDLIESFSIFLFDVYRRVAQVNPRDICSTSSCKFESLGIEDQLTIFSRDFAIDPRWIDTFVGYNKLRNCLAHRQGKVAERDCQDGKSLMVKWIAIDARFSDSIVDTPKSEDNGFMKHLIVSQPIGENTVAFSTQMKQKHFALGSVLNFHPEEIFEILYTFQLGASALFTVTNQQE